MRAVAAIGIGQTKVEEQWDRSLKEIAGEAIFAAVQDCGISHIDGVYVGNMMSASANSQQNLGAYLTDWIGAKNISALRLESACSSGSAAFRAAFLAVASGEVDIALAVGVEKMTDSPSNEITSALATAASADWEADQGLSFVALNALLMQRYMHETGWKHRDFANFSINAHANAVHNPFARFHMPITEDKFVNAAMICDPINLMDSSPIGDGAAAIVLVPAEMVSGKVIRVVGSSAATDTIAVHSRKDPTWLSAAESSSKKAYAQAGIGPQDIDFFEYHDAFTIMAALSLEANGFTERGKGPQMALDGAIRLDGSLPVATMGGLKARGHPVGATGMYQLVEVIQQLRGTAGENQLEKARIGMAQNIGGSGSNIITHILRND
ncbi:MAG TPA: thiolase domain-containing protein [Anaerolineaceae bacterium]|nr:thiolase domain-containing protein [Anaerolineaceae bacterium]